MSADTSIEALAAALQAAIAAANAPNDLPTKKLKFKISDSTILPGTDNPHIMDRSNSALWLAFRSKAHNGLREVYRDGNSLWHMLCKGGVEHDPPMRLATYDKIGSPDNLDSVTFTGDWSLQVSTFFEAILHPTSTWLVKLRNSRADDKPFAAFLHLLDKEYLLTCTHPTLSDARKALEIEAKFLPTKQLLSQFFTDYDKLVKNFEHQKRRIAGGDVEYRYPWHAYYSQLL